MLYYTIMCNDLQYYAMLFYYCSVCLRVGGAQTGAPQEPGWQRLPTLSMPGDLKGRGDQS